MDTPAIDSHVVVEPTMSRRTDESGSMQHTLWTCLVVMLVVVGQRASTAQPQPTPQTLMAGPSGAVAADSFAPEGPWRMRWPTQRWSAPASGDPLPPPPGWMAAEFAGLGRTMGSSPESEPLVPGDEMTLETGRLSSHKDGFFQRLAFSTNWIGRGGTDGLGILETRLFATVAVPLPSRDFPLLITPGLDVNFFDGPRTAPVPAEVYAAYLDLLWLPKLSERWLGVLSVAPGIYSDLRDVQSDAIRVKAKAMARFDWVPNRWQVLFGILYLNRDDVNLLPAGGLIYDPNDDTHLEFVFPQPKLARRIRQLDQREDWIYLGGEFGGDTWSFRRDATHWDMLTQTDWRILLGWERKRPGGAGQHVEIGYVFSREVQFSSGLPTYTSGSAFMIRGGIDF